MEKNMHRYDNLVDHPRPVPKLPMDRMKRAAQFAPFAALTGFDDKIKETSRLTDREISLDENEWEDLQYQLEYLQEHLAERKIIEVTFFVSDRTLHPGSTKTGGTYITKEGVVKKIDTYEKSLIFEDGDKIRLQAIVNIDIKQVLD